MKNYVRLMKYIRPYMKQLVAAVACIVLAAGANLFTHLTQVSSGIFLRGIECRFKIGAYFNQHCIDLGKMSLEICAK